MQVTEAIKVFLKARQLPSNTDLVARWNDALETQVNVAPGNGEAVEGKRTTWSDGINSWWNIRLPKNPDGKDGPPFWQDYELKFPFEMHAEAIGCTGWDWKALRSRWVAFDFDSLTSHAKGVGVSDEELERIKQAAEALPYVETRKSTGGSGIHLYVYFDAAGIPTANHTEHAALARCILGMMSSETNFDFASQIDCCGGVMWLWARKMTAENHGLELLKPATQELSLADLPANWRDHIEVVQKKRSKVRVNGVADDQMETFDALASSHKSIPLDASHKAQIEELMRSGFTTLWLSDQHLLQTHTCALKDLIEKHAKELKLVGFFKTNSEGKDKGSPNCYLFPLPNGAWKVYRFSQGISEIETWEQDGHGWTTCYFNRAPDLAIAARALGGMEDPDKKGEWLFDTAGEALEVASVLGQKIDVLDKMTGRETRLKANKDGRLAVEIAKEDDDEKWKGWIAKKDKWVRVFDTKTTAEETDSLADYDHRLREVMTTAKKPAGWMMFKAGAWYWEEKDNIKLSLLKAGLSKPEAEAIMGGAVDMSWNLVNLPFHPEYPGGRQWNMDAPQLIYQPAVLGDDEAPVHPHWDKILNHIGQTLTEPLRAAPWAQRAGIKTGAQYLLCWIANMIRYPLERLPYLFLFGPEDSGKSIFHESLALLMTKGCVSADRSLTTEFNGELANCVLAYVEEKDISKAKGALNKIKDMITADTIPIRQMRTDQYQQPNTTHWVQCANKRENCPIFPGDTRITVAHVPDLGDRLIPKKELKERLKDEAPHFMYSVMNCELPEPTSRLRLPIVVTADKAAAQEANDFNFPWAADNYEFLGDGEPDLPPEERLVKADVYAHYRGTFPKGMTEHQFFRKLGRWAKGQEKELGDGYGPTVPGVEGRTTCYTRLYRIDTSKDNEIVAPNANDLKL
jgi:hypothetical protein